MKHWQPTYILNETIAHFLGMLEKLEVYSHSIKSRIMMTSRATMKLILELKLFFEKAKILKLTILPATGT